MQDTKLYQHILGLSSAVSPMERLNGQSQALIRKDTYGSSFWAQLARRCRLRGLIKFS